MSGRTATISAHNGRVATISTHNGTSVSFEHNRRNPEICSHEEHIDPNGIHETWLDEDLRDFYERTFGEAQREYDGRQKREERKIGDYLDKITREAAEAEQVNEEIRRRNKEHKIKGEPMERLKVAKKPIYEMVCGVYVQEGEELTQKEKRDLLHLHVFGDKDHPSWEQRNPGLKLVGVYYHADELDADDHIHIDYVPVAECSRGMKVQNSLEKALNKSGFRSEKFGRTAQIQFQESENSNLQRICEEYGIEVDHPQRGKRSKHKSTSELKRESALNEREKDIDARDTMVNERDAEQKAREIALVAREKDIEEQEKKLRYIEEREKALNKREATINARESNLQDQEARSLERAKESIGLLDKAQEMAKKAEDAYSMMSDGCRGIDKKAYQTVARRYKFAVFGSDRKLVRDGNNKLRVFGGDQLVETFDREVREKQAVERQTAVSRLHDVRPEALEVEKARADAFLADMGIDSNSLGGREIEF